MVRRRPLFGFMRNVIALLGADPREATVTDAVNARTSYFDLFS